MRANAWRWERRVVGVGRPASRDGGTSRARTRRPRSRVSPRSRPPDRRSGRAVRSRSSPRHRAEPDAGQAGHVGREGTHRGHRLAGQLVQAATLRPERSATNHAARRSQSLGCWSPATSARSPYPREAGIAHTIRPDRSAGPGVRDREPGKDPLEAPWRWDAPCVRSP